MNDENNYQPKPKDTKYDSFSKACERTRDELGVLILKSSLEKGNTIEFPSLGIVIHPEKKD